MTYSMEFRVAVAKAYDECLSSIEVAEAFACSASWVRRLIQRRRQTDSLAPRPPKLPDNNKLDQADLARLRALVDKQPDLTVGELTEAMGRKVSPTTTWRATRKLGLTHKKSPCVRPSRTGPTSRKRGGVGSSTLPK